ncbi:MAG TPA: ribosomal protein S18-alanine N-acetyltransferase [Acidimicrobiales bacterium]|nr:ribosomal protein S18-alanine N-acetyltransferase [Acidimicrobiales bacterium]
MSVSWNLRLAERRDVPDLLSIEVAQFPEPWTRAMLLDEITNTETRRYTVAVESKKLIGYLGIMYVMDELHVNTIGTLPGHEGKGVATSLMDEAWVVAKERGVKRATLEVAVSNTRAQELYFRYGFSPVGVRKNYYERTNEDALILWAELTSDP